MVRAFEIDNDCEMSAELFWSLRGDTNFDAFYARLDKQWYTLQEEDASEGKDGKIISRDFKLVMEDNPVPRPLRPLLPKNLVVKEFAFRVKCKFHTDHFDEAHPYEYTTILPVMTERVLVDGIQWAEPVTATMCRLRARINVTVHLGPLSAALERTIESEMR
mgnify:CR=1 FL=1